MTKIQRFVIPARQRGGFTLVEAMIVSALMVLLAAVLSAAWTGMGRPLVDAIARARIAQEASLAVASLARDWGGSLAGATGNLDQGRLVGRMVVDDSQLWLCFDGGASPNGVADWAAPDTVIIYEVQSNKLVRRDLGSGATFTVAKHVQSLDLTDQGTAVQVNLSFSYRDISRTYTIDARDP